MKPRTTALNLFQVVAEDGVGAGCRSRAPESHRPQHKTRQARAEAPQCLTPRDGLGQALGQFIEFVVHNFTLSSGLFACL
jgi:hypothetical protein